MSDIRERVQDAIYANVGCNVCWKGWETAVGQLDCSLEDAAEVIAVIRAAMLSPEAIEAAARGWQDLGPYMAETVADVTMEANWSELPDEIKQGISMNMIAAITAALAAAGIEVEDV